MTWLILHRKPGSRNVFRKIDTTHPVLPKNISGVMTCLYRKCIPKNWCHPPSAPQKYFRCDDLPIPKMYSEKLMPPTQCSPKIFPVWWPAYTRDTLPIPKMYSEKVIEHRFWGALGGINFLEYISGPRLSMKNHPSHGLLKQIFSVLKNW